MVNNNKLDVEREFYLTKLSKTDGERDTLKREFYLNELSLDSGNVEDLEKQWLSAQVGVTKNNVNDMWKQFLNLAGYTGHIDTMRRDYYKDNS